MSGLEVTAKPSRSTQLVQYGTKRPSRQFALDSETTRRVQLLCCAAIMLPVA
jgi:hypothetical protein